MADEDPTTPRAHSSRLPTEASSGPQSAEAIGVAHDLTKVYKLQTQRRCEYAAQLRPLADEDLPSALRSNPAYLLHYGFECALPRLKGDWSAKDMNARSVEIARSMARKTDNVNKAIASGKSDPLQEAFTVTDAARPRDIFVLALYSSDTPNPQHYSQAEIERIREELRKEFETVEGPMWHWDEFRHGAETYSFRPFDKVYRCHPLAAILQSSQKPV